jgi:hypothetical protein
MAGRRRVDASTTGGGQLTYARGELEARSSGADRERAVALVDLGHLQVREHERQVVTVGLDYDLVEIETQRSRPTTGSRRVGDQARSRVEHLPLDPPDIAIEVDAGLVVDEAIVERLSPDLLANCSLDSRVYADLEEVPQVLRSDAGARIGGAVDDHLVVPHVGGETVIHERLIEDVVEQPLQVLHRPVPTRPRARASP